MSATPVTIHRNFVRDKAISFWQRLDANGAKQSGSYLRQRADRRATDSAVRSFSLPIESNADEQDSILKVPFVANAESLHGENAKRKATSTSTPKTTRHKGVAMRRLLVNIILTGEELAKCDDFKLRPVFVTSCRQMCDSVGIGIREKYDEQQHTKSHSSGGDTAAFSYPRYTRRSSHQSHVPRCIRHRKCF